QKTPPNAATVQTMRDGIEKLEILRDDEKKKLPGLREAVNATTKKHGDASAKAFTEERKILAVKEQLEKDQFTAKSSAGAQRLGGKALHTGSDALHAL